MSVRPPRIRALSFHHMPTSFTPTVPNSYGALVCIAITHGHMPCMKSLFVRPDVCRWLPSDSTSQWTPLPLFIAFPLLGWLRDLHPLDPAHAERTIKNASLIHINEAHPKKSFFFSYALEWSSVLFAIHKLSIRATLCPNASLRVQNLTSMAHHSVSVAIATWGICCHFQSLPVLFGDVVDCMFQAAIILFVLCGS